MGEGDNMLQIEGNSRQFVWHLKRIFWKYEPTARHIIKGYQSVEFGTRLMKHACHMRITLSVVNGHSENYAASKVLAKRTLGRTIRKSTAGCGVIPICCCLEYRGCRL